MNKTQTAGGVVRNSRGDVIVVNQNGNSWSLPKGHIDPGETARQAAEREIKEESGVRQLQFVEPLGEYDRFRIGLDGREDQSEEKHIVFFLYTTKQTDLRPEDPDNPEARWVHPNDVADLLTHPKDKAFFREVLPRISDHGVA